jgi:hypothetical protein
MTASSPQATLESAEQRQREAVPEEVERRCGPGLLTRAACILRPNRPASSCSASAGWAASRCECDGSVSAALE